MAVFTIFDSGTAARQSTVTGAILDSADPLGGLLGGSGSQTHDVLSNLSGVEDTSSGPLVGAIAPTSARMLSAISPTGGQRAPTPNMQLLRITGTTGTAGLYDAEVVTVSPDDASVTVLRTGVRVRAITGTFATNDIVQASRVSYTTNPHAGFAAKQIGIGNIVSVNDSTNSSQYIVISNQGTDLSVGSTAPAYDSYKTYYKGQVVSNAGSTYRYNSDTPAYGVLITDPTWEDITGKGITVINIPQGSFTVLTGDFDYTASAGEVIVCDSIGGTAGNSKIRLPTDHIGKSGDEVIIKYVNWGAGTYLSVYGACDYDYGSIASAPASPIWIFGDADYVYGSCFPPPCSMILRWTHYDSGSPYERWVVAATDNLYRDDGLYPNQAFYSRPPNGNGTIAGLAFRRGFYAGGTLSITKADVGLGNVDNTSDVNKPVSTAQQSAIDAGESYSAENKEGFTILAGMACSVHSSGTGIIKASSADNTKIAIGLIRADTANTFSGLIQKSGLFTLSDWTSVIGASTLAAKTTYFLDPSTPGKLTATVPTTTGQTVQIIGTAVSATTLDLDIGVPILL